MTNSNLTSLKAEVDIDKLITIPTNLSNLSNSVNNDIVTKQCMIN